MSLVAFADASPMAETNTPFTIDFTGVDFTPQQADFFRSWVDSPYSMLAVDGSWSSPAVLYFYVLNGIPSFSADVWAENTRRGLYMNCGAYTICSYFPETGEVSLSFRLGGSKENISIWKYGGVYYPLLTSGSCFSDPSAYYTPLLDLFTSFREVAIVDDTDIFDSYVSTFPILPKVTVNYKFSDGSKAAPSFVKKYAVGDSYSVPSPVIRGCDADITVVSGDNLTTSIIHEVTYTKKKLCDISIVYQYEDGKQAFPPFNQTFYLGESYSIPSPTLDGYVSSIQLVSGAVTDDTELSKVYTVVYVKNNAIVSLTDFHLFNDIILKSIGAIVVCGCLLFSALCSVRFLIKIFILFLHI